MKLELKHLAPYLPYQLKGKYQLHDVIGINAYANDESRGVTLNVNNVQFFLSYSKPILKPLDDLNESDLTKKWDKEHTIRYNLFGLSMKLGGADSINILRYPIQIINDLFENHYDIFGLIPQGLAIDINTLDK